MFIVAGPPGAGKSTIFSVRNFADRVFNADDRAMELNGGSYRSIPLTIRKQVNREFEIFVYDNIKDHKSFAIETTLRSKITFEQAKQAKQVGFKVFMIYIILDTFERHLERVTQRALLGGHAASKAVLQRIYNSSLKNFPIVLNHEKSGIDEVHVFDNSIFKQRPKLVMKARYGRIISLATDFPRWLQFALNWAESDLQKIRSNLHDFH